MTISTPDSRQSEPLSKQTFESVLFATGRTPDGLDEIEPPDCLHDLNLDQVFDAVVGLRPKYRISPFFWALLDDAQAIGYRHEVLRDLEGDELRQTVESFATGMSRTRKALSQAKDAHYQKPKDARFLEAVGCYCESVRGFASELAGAEPRSVAFRTLVHYLEGYAGTSDFRRLDEEQKRIADTLDLLAYTIEIRGDRVHVDSFGQQEDYGAEIRSAFERFRQGQVKNYRFRYERDPRLNHIEAEILDRVARLNPQPFTDLATFHTEHSGFADPVIRRFDREVQFYLAFLEYLEPLRTAGLCICEPEVCERSKEIRAVETFDLGLARKLVDEGEPVVTNDIELRDQERIFVVSGPNQGGKTTFARTFGQLHYLARLGLGVPGSEARLFLGDRIFTHFERQEEHSNLSGKLEDDLIRVKKILDQATPRSIVVMNESFSSTALDDARLLGRRVLERLSELDLLCVYVTFVDELASLNEKVVSLTSTVDPDEPATRTFMVVRHPADGKAYAIAIAEKYRLTYDQLKERIG
ncbi:MAG TPA: hypothetical protein VMH33_00330 [Solirubrobacterales bacterium]|nr:hypothetical protein [Solirubrobacterales bacterium]